MLTKKNKLIKKADRELQEAGRRIYEYCEVCGAPMTVMHHYIPKSRSSFLRYNWDNCVPLCHGCHFKLHNSDPFIQNKINEKRGKEWYKGLEQLQVRGVKEGFKFTIAYLNDKIEVLKKLTRN
jgi:5-methylcytosine-specific restriction endonuclease McrA